MNSGTTFDALSPLPPQVTQIGYGIFQTPVETSPSEFTIPTTYSLFVSQTAPASNIGVSGDWYQWVLLGLGIVRIYQKTDEITWTLITTISGAGGGGSGDVVGPATAIDSDIVLFDTGTGKVIKDSGIKIAGSGSTASSSEVSRGNDPRMTNSRVPTAHAITHKSGGTDPIKLDELAAPTDVTTLNATILAHGLLPKLPGTSTTFLAGDGTFITPATPTGVLTARNSSQFDKAASAVLSNITGLSVTLSAGATYIFEVVLFVNTDTTGLAQASVGGSCTISSLRYEGQAFGVGVNEVRTRATAFGTAVAKLEGAVSDGRLQIWGTIVVNAGGTLTAQFSQLVASGTSSVLSGSYLKAYPV